MGRHSAPDEDEGGELRTVVPLGYSRPLPGRHSRPDDDEEAPPSIVLEAVRPTPQRRAEPEQVEEPEPVEEVTAEQVTEPVPVPVAPEAPPSESTELAIPAAKELVPIGKGNQSTSADLALLREHSEVRNRVIAAVVAPFVLYTVVMYLIGAVNVYFIWVWIPLVTAGVVAGSILDSAHRKRTRDAD